MGPRTARLFDQCSSCCQPSTLFARRLRQERRDRDRRGISSRSTYLACVAYVCTLNDALATLAETCGQFARGAMVLLRENKSCRKWLNHTVSGLHVLHASRSRKKRIATTGLPVGTIGTRKNWGVNIDPHMDSFTAPLRPSCPSPLGGASVSVTWASLAAACKRSASHGARIILTCVLGPRPASLSTL